MGFGLIIGAISAVASVASGLAQASAAKKAARAQEAAAAEQKEARNVQAAATENTAMESRRQRVREARIRRAQIIAASENAGTNQSSGQSGAVGAISTNLAGLLGNSLGESAAARGINAANQRAEDQFGRARQFEAKGAAIGAWGNAIQSGISGFSSIFDKPGN